MDSKYIELIADIREKYVTRDLNTDLLRDLSQRLTKKSSHADIGTVIRKILEYNSRFLLERSGASADGVPLGQVLGRLEQNANHLEKGTEKWTKLFHYTHLLKKLGNLAVHEKDGLNELDIDVMIPAICQVCTLTADLVPERTMKPSPRVVALNPFANMAPITVPSVGSKILWVGNIPLETTPNYLKLIMNNSNVKVVMKDGDMVRDGVPMRYAFLNFVNIEAATAAKLVLERQGFEARYKYSK